MIKKRDAKLSKRNTDGFYVSLPRGPLSNNLSTCFVLFWWSKEAQIFYCKVLKYFLSLSLTHTHTHRREVMEDKKPNFALVCCVLSGSDIINMHSLPLHSPQWLVLIEKFTRYFFTATACGLVAMETKLSEVRVNTLAGTCVCFLHWRICYEKSLESVVDRSSVALRDSVISDRGVLENSSTYISPVSAHQAHPWSLFMFRQRLWFFLIIHSSKVKWRV